MTSLQNRISSIDLFRALTMLLMLFVNDFAGMEGIPHFLEHADTYEDMMGFSDLVFPAFLFCMGMSIPFAIKSREEKGDSAVKIGGHVFLRSLALIVMGLFSMNCSSIEGGLSHQWFCILMVIGFFLVWNAYPKESSWKKFFIGLRCAGIALLVFLFIYRICNSHPIVTSWWGILGLIGWAYLFSSIIYYPLRKNFVSVIVGWLVLMVLVILNNAGIHMLGTLSRGWTHLGIAFTGATVSSVMVECSRVGKDKRFILVCLVAALLFLLAGMLCHKFWICSKNLATPTWMFLSMAVSLVVIALFYYIEDIRKVGVLKGKVMSTVMAPAGTCTLTCYMIPTLTYAIRQLLSLSYPTAISAGLPGLVKSLVFSFVIITLAGVLSRIKIRLKL